MRSTDMSACLKRNQQHTDNTYGSLGFAGAHTGLCDLLVVQLLLHRELMGAARLQPHQTLILPWRGRQNDHHSFGTSSETSGQCLR